MKFLRYLLLAIGIIVALFLGIAAVLPSKAHVERSIVIDRPPTEVFAVAQDYSQFDDWSPWAKLDTNMKVELSNPPAGQGATYVWSGNDKAGAGKMTITQVVPNERVTMDLHFLQPMESRAETYMALQPQGGNTQVTWGIDSELAYPVGRWFGLWFDDLIGSDYEKGLANLKRYVEARPASAPVDSTAAPAQPS